MLTHRQQRLCGCFLGLTQICLECAALILIKCSDLSVLGTCQDCSYVSCLLSSIKQYAAVRAKGLSVDFAKLYVWHLT